MNKILKFGTGDTYIRVTSPESINFLLKDTDKDTSSKLLKILLSEFSQEEIFLGGSVLKNKIYDKKEDYEDIDLLIVSPSKHNYNMFGLYEFPSKTDPKILLYRIIKINEKIPELKTTGTFPRYILKNSKGSDFDINFDYRKTKENHSPFGIRYK